MIKTQMMIRRTRLGKADQNNELMLVYTHAQQQQKQQQQRSRHTGRTKPSSVAGVLYNIVYFRCKLFVHCAGGKSPVATLCVVLIKFVVVIQFKMQSEAVQRRRAVKSLVCQSLCHVTSHTSPVSHSAVYTLLSLQSRRDVNDHTLKLPVNVNYNKPLLQIVFNCLFLRNTISPTGDSDTQIFV